MNKNYRSVWNESLNAWVAIPEIAHARGRRSISRAEAGDNSLTVRFTKLVSALRLMTTSTGLLIGGMLGDALRIQLSRGRLLSTVSLGLLTAVTFTDDARAQVVAPSGSLQLCRQGQPGSTLGASSSANPGSAPSSLDCTTSWAFSLHNFGNDTGGAGLSASTARVSGDYAGHLELLGTSVSINGQTTFNSNAIFSGKLITQLGAGKADTDAVNVSQLKSVISGFGGNAAFAPATGLMNSPTYTIGKATYHNVGDALTALNNTGNRYFKAVGNNDGTDDAVVDNIGDIAIGRNAVADSNSNVPGVIAIGDGAKAKSLTYGTSVAIGKGSFATDSSVSVGELASSATAGVAIGRVANASGTYGIAIGERSVSADSGVALGLNAKGNTGSVALGRNANAGNTGSVALGQEASTAGSSYGLAGGNKAKASAFAAVALGASSVGSGIRSLALGPDAAAWSDKSIAIGNAAVAGKAATTDPAAPAKTGAVALGDGTAATGTNSLALGQGATAAQDGAVALGSGSSTAVAQVTTSGTIAGTTYQYAGNAPTSTVSVGAADSERTITNVAAGRVSATSTDAVNGSQLHATNTELSALDGRVDTLGANTAKNLGGGSTYNPTTGAVSSPTYNVGNTTVNNVGDAIDNIDGRVTNNTTAIENINNGGGIKYFHANSTKADSQASGADSVAIGPLAKAVSVDAVAMGNGALAGTAASGGDPATAKTGAIAIGAQAQATGTNSLALGQGATAAQDGAVALGSGSSTAVAQVTTSGTIAGTTYQYAGNAPTSTVSVGAADSERTITNVAAGRVSATSTDAVNGSQLHATNTELSALDGRVDTLGANTAKNLGGGSTYNPTTGAVSSPTYNVGNTTVNNVGDAIDNIDGRVTNNTTAIENINNGGGIKYFHANSTKADSQASGADSVAIGPLAKAVSVDAVAMGNGALAGTAASGGDPATAKTGAIAIGAQAQATGTNSLALGQGATAAQDGAVALGSGSSTAVAQVTTSGTIAGTTYQYAGNAPTSTVSVGAADSERTITNVAAGRVSATSTDAVNGSQLHATNQAVNTLANNINDGALGPVQRTTAPNTLTLVANGASAAIPGPAQTLTNVKAGTVSTTSTDAVNGAQLNALASSTASSLGGGSTVNADGSITSPSYMVGGSNFSNVGGALSNLDGRVTNNTTAIENINNGGGIKYFHANSTKADSQASGADSVAIGPLAKAVSVDAVAMGNGALAGTAASGGDPATAKTGAIAIGAQAQATGTNSLALGQGATAAQDGAVALGSGSSTAVAQVTTSGTIAGTTYQYAGNAPTSTVSVGAADSERTITNVAAGRVSATSTDAVNGSQLHATNQAVNTLANNINDGALGPVQRTTAPNTLTLVANGASAAIPGPAQTLTNVKAGTVSTTSTDAVNGAQLNALASSTASSLGGGSTVNADGSITSPSYMVGGSNFSNVGGALSNLDGRVTNNTTAIENINNGGGIKYFHANSTKADSQASGADSVAIGPLAKAVSVDAVAMGNGALAGTAASGGDPATAKTGAIAIGAQAQATGTNSLALGQGATAAQDGAVALGSGSSTAVAQVTTSGTIAGTTYQYAGNAPTSTVSVGAADSERTITNVAAGRVSATSTDAVNGSQLHATNQAVNTLANNINDGALGPVQRTTAPNTLTLVANGASAAIPGPAQTLTNVKAGTVSTTSTDAVNGAQLNALASSTASSLGGGSTVNADGSITSPSYMVGGSNFSNVGGALSNLDGRVTNNTTAIENINNGGGIKYFHANSTKADSQASGADSVAIGPLAKAVSVDAVAMGNGALAGTAASGGDPATAKTGAIAIGAQAQATGTNSLALGQGATAAQDGAVALGSGSSTAVAQVTTSGTIAGTTYQYAGNAPTSTVSVGAADSERTITNVAAGRVSATSTDAVNGSQLHATNTELSALDGRVDTLGANTAKNLGGGSTYNPTTGAVSSPTYNVGNTTVNNVGDAIDNIDGRVTNNTTAIENINNGGGIKYFHANSTKADSQASGADSVAIGPLAKAVSVDAVAMGNGALAGTAASGGDPATAKTGAIAIGAQAQATGTNSLALGQGATAAQDGAVALGSGSSTAVAQVTTSGTIAGTTYQYAGNAPTSTVSVGAADSERTITNVAAGRVSATSTDAVNGSQLHATNTELSALDGRVDTLGANTAKNLGGGSTYNPTTGAVSSPTYNVGNTTVNNVGDAIDNIDGRVTNNTTAIENINNGGGIKYFHANSTKADSQASGADSVAIGPLAKAVSVDAVAMGNGALAGTAASGGDPATAKTGAIAIGAQAQATGTNSLALGQGATAAQDGAVALGSGSSTAVAQVTTSGTIAGTTYQYAGNAPTSTVSVGAADSERTITNVAAGRVSATSTDAVNGSQLHATNTELSALDGRVDTLGANTAKNLGGGSTYNPTTGAVSSPTYNVGNTTVNNVGDAIDNIDGRVTNNTTAIENINNGGGIKYFHANSTKADSQASGADSVAIGPLAKAVSVDAVAMGNGALAGTAASGGDPATAKTGAIAIGAQAQATGTNSLALGQGATAAQDGAVALGSGSSTAVAQVTTSGTIAGTTYQYAGNAPTSTVSVGAADSERTITNVAAGRVSATSTDAVNGSQLHATNQAVNTLANNINDGALGPVQRTTAPNTLTLVANGASAAIPGPAQTLTNVKAGTVSTTSTDAVNGAQLNALASSTASSLGGGSTVNADGSITSPSYMVGGSNFSNVGGALSNLDGRVTNNTTAIENINNGGGIKYFHANSTKADSQASGADSVAIGPLAKAVSVDAVAMGNGALAGTAASGGDPATAKTGAIAIGAQAQATGTNSLALGQGATAAQDGAVALGSGSSTAVAQVTTSGTIAGTTYQYAGNAPTSTVSVGAAGSERTITNVAAGRVSATSTDAVNGSQLHATNQAIETVRTTAGKGWQLSANGEATSQNIAPGDTVNFEQGDNIEVTRTGGKIRIATARNASFDSVTIGSMLMNNSGISIDSVVHLNQIGLVINGGPQVTTAGINAGGKKITNVAEGVDPTDAVNMSQLTQVTNTAASKWVTGSPENYAAPTAGGMNSTAVGSGASASASNSLAMGTGASATTDNSVALGNGSTTSAAVANKGTTINGKNYSFAGADPAGVVSVGSEDNERQIQNVAAGRISEDSTDAINGSQLYATNQAIIEHLGSAIEEKTMHYFSVNDGGIQGGNYNNDGATGLNSVASGVGATAAGAGAVATGQNASASADNTVALGANAVASSSGGIALGAGSTADRAGMNGAHEAFSSEAVHSTQGAVSVGSGGNERQITNVAGGTAPTDAVNVRQLQAVQTHATAYVDAKVSALQVNIRDVARKAYAGVASAMAMEGAPYVPGKTTYAAGMGYFESQSAIGIGLRRTAKDGRWSVTGGVSASAAGVAARVGISGVWD